VSTSTRWRFAFGLCCHSNETRAPIANLPNSAHIEGTPYSMPVGPLPKLHPGPCTSVGMRQGTDTHRETNRHTDRLAWPIYISRRQQLTWNVLNILYIQLGEHTQSISWTRCSPVVHRVKSRRSNLRSQYDLYVVGQHGVLCEVKWRRFVALFEWN